MPDVNLTSDITTSIDIGDAGRVFIPSEVTGYLRHDYSEDEISLTLSDWSQYDKLMADGDVNTLRINEHTLLRVDGDDSRFLLCFRCAEKKEFVGIKSEKYAHGYFYQNCCC